MVAGLKMGRRKVGVLFFTLRVLFLVSVYCTCIASDICDAPRCSSLQYVNRALARTFASLEMNTTGVPNIPIQRSVSVALGACHHLRASSDYDRIGCATPNDVRHLYNVKILHGRLVVYLGDDDYNRTQWNLPSVRSIIPRKRQASRLPISFVKGPMIPETHCKSYFNGTLHFTGRSTVHNVYHARKFILK